MPQLVLRYDLRCPEFTGTERPALYRAAVDQVAWADGLGFDRVMVAEHHGVDDGYLPSPMLFLAACAARTESIRLDQTVVLLPLHDPVRVAEDVAVLDNLSNGRAQITVAGGYVKEDMAMFGVDPKDRGRLMEEKLEVLYRCWQGEPFEYQGRQVRVMPRPVQQPRPPVQMGGNAKVAAERAARMADGFQPGGLQGYRWYIDACKALGKKPNRLGPAGPSFLYLAEDVDAAWEYIGPLALYETNYYARWQKEAGVPNPVYKHCDDVSAVRNDPSYRVMTPEACIALCEELGDQGSLIFHPLMSGMDPEKSWASLRLFEQKVLPHISVTRSTPAVVSA